KDHVIQSHKILPGVAYLEMATQAIREALDEFDANTQAIQFKNIVWIQPIVVDEPSSVRILLYPEEEQIAFEVITGIEEETLVHSQGIASVVNVAKTKQIDLDSLQSRFNQIPFSIEAIYDYFASTGISYGTSFRAL